MKFYKEWIITPSLLTFKCTILSTTHLIGHKVQLDRHLAMMELV